MILAVAAALTACGTGHVTKSSYDYTNADFSSYVQHFKELAQASSLGPDFQVTSTITLVDSDIVVPGVTPVPGNFIVGECICNDARTITLAPGWVHLVPTDQEAIVLHELGHCESYRSHLNTQQPNGDLTSIMDADPTDYGKDKSRYVAELFSVIGQDCANIGTVE